MALVNTLLMGFLIGLKHALEADHVAAVASLASKTTSLREGLVLGATWGLGHTVTLFIFSSIVLILDTMISAQLALALEFLVGCMLVLMGGAIIKEIISKRVHLHMHKHSNGTTHLHFHSHAQDQNQSNTDQHIHSHKFSLRALLVGMMHGTAGSAALIVLTLDSVSSIETRLVYILLFGAGSTLGMTLLSFMIIIPLQQSKNTERQTYQSLQVIIGLVTLFLGIIIVYETSVTNGLLI